LALAQLLQDLGYTSLKANPDVWLREAIRDDGHNYYEMLFVYVDNILALSHRAEDVMKEIATFQGKRWQYQTTGDLSRSERCKDAVT
jgi:hypothetical protein